MKQTQIYGFNKSYKMLTQTSNNEKKQRSKQRSNALPWHSSAVGWAWSGEIVREEIRLVRASSRSTGMEMLCFTEMKRWSEERSWYDWRAVGDPVWKGAHHVISVSITHNSKIRKLSYENRVMETELSFGQTTFLLWVPPFLSYELWKLRIELSNLIGQTAS